MTKEKIALIAGCSHSAGSEIDGSEDSLFQEGTGRRHLTSRV